MIWTPHATVATLVEREGRFLMVEEISDGLRVFNQPAGHVEQGERLIDAAVRETLEETGWQIQPTALLGIYIYTAANQVTYHRYCFVAKAIAQVSDQLDTDIIAAHWLTLAEIGQRAGQLRSPLVSLCVADYRKGQQFPLTLITEICN